MDRFEFFQDDIIKAPLSWQKQGLTYTVSGYGKRIPTQYKVKHDGRLYRVYCCQFSNTGTLYIQTRKGDVTVDVYLYLKRGDA